MVVVFIVRVMKEYDRAKDPQLLLRSQEKERQCQSVTKKRVPPAAKITYFSASRHCQSWVCVCLVVVSYNRVRGREVNDKDVNSEAKMEFTNR